MSVYESIMAAVFGRLTAAPKTWADDIRRAHLTAPPRNAGRVVHLIDGADDFRNQKPCGERIANFSVAVFVRTDDAGSTLADPLKLEVYRRLNPSAPYSGSVSMVPGRIAPNTEIADLDVTRVDMEFRFTYPTGGEWAL